MATKNFYGLSEGVFKACQFLGLKFPLKVLMELQISDEHVPSDYLRDDFEFDAAMKRKLCSACNWTDEKFEKAYGSFRKKFSAQKPLKQTKTDLNIYFCDYVLFRLKQPSVSASNYFDFEFYKKSYLGRRGFVTDGYNNMIRFVCNDYLYVTLANDKSQTNELFRDYLHRDWLSMRKCTFEEFQAFVEKHPRFFSKPIASSFGVGAKIVNVTPDKNVEKLFNKLKGKGRLLEELIVQHEEISEFCPDTVNTIRVNTILDIHGAVHIVTTSGRFGRVGKVVDNFGGGGYSVVIDSKTGIIISDAVNEFHERAEKHPDTGKIFKGFQYPSWEKVRSAVTEMARMLPHLRRIAWDIAINVEGDAVLVEANGNVPGVNTYQVPDNTGRRHLFKPFIDELRNYKVEQMRFIGYRFNNLKNFESAYDPCNSRVEERLQFAMMKLIPDCASLMDVGCRKDKLAKSFCAENIEYYPVDFKAHDDEVIACDFNEDFPDIKVDTCLCAFTAEYVENLPQFLANMCNAAQQQVLMICRPINRQEMISDFRWKNPFLTDFTEEFLIKTMEQNNFQLAEQYPTDNKAVTLYDFRKISDD